MANEYARNVNHLCAKLEAAEQELAIEVAIRKQLKVDLDAAEAKLQAVGKLPDTWRTQEQGYGNGYCADELQSILDND